MTTDERKRVLQLKMETLDALVNAQSNLVPVLIERYKVACLQQDPHTAEVLRAEITEVQGEMLDHIYGRCALMREAGII